MRHVAPHRWADAAAGRIDAAEQARMTAHAGRCDRCAAARGRISGAREAFPEIAGATSPELRWEQIGARVYWASSQERRLRERTTAEMTALRRRRGWLLPALGALAVGASALMVVALIDREPVVAPVRPVAVVMPDQIVPVELVAMDAPAAASIGIAPVPLVGLVTLAQGDARLGGAASASLFDTPVVVGMALETGTGRMAIQIDAGIAFAVGPSSRLTLARLDQAAIELHVDGAVSVEVAHRAPGQRFTVVAGGRVIEVRGTAFEVVHHGGRVEVACRHGVVAVRDAAAPAGAAVEVIAGQRWTASADQALLAHPPAPLTADQIAELGAQRPARLPAWSQAQAMLRTTGPVQVAAPRGRAVRVDGVVIGEGGLTVRLMSGRHLIEAEQAPGRFGRGEWVETGGDGALARIEPLAAAADATAGRRAGIAARRKQLDRAVDRQRLAGCIRSLAKQGVADGTHVVLEVGVDATGAVSFLNVGDTDLPARAALCVRDAVAEVSFAAGPAATWTHRFAF